MPEHRTSVSCEDESICFHNALLSQVEVHVKSALGAERDMVWSEVPVQAENVVKNKLAVPLLRMVDSWTMAVVVIPGQTVLMHVAHYLKLSARM